MLTICWTYLFIYIHRLLWLTSLFYGWLLAWPLRASTAALNCTLLATKLTHYFADVFNQWGFSYIILQWFFFPVFIVKQPMLPAVEVGGVPTTELTGNSHKVNFFLAWLFLQLYPLPLPLFFFLPYSWQNLWLNGLPFYYNSNSVSWIVASGFYRGCSSLLQGNDQEETIKDRRHFWIVRRSLTLWKAS